ncbi:hypothetical protein PoB_004963800 [Plakobranchus ocellatus]|uniref:Uncharacterized protein n=1 Tax=Plakobranchus ocellatus TaxID=259542 RepID=A0AAV4BV95_9GAST|nr:hypothetical protein PoB_004963800 [Plakobranchus ocellatus]
MNSDSRGEVTVGIESIVEAVAVCDSSCNSLSRFDRSGDIGREWNVSPAFVAVSISEEDKLYRPSFKIQVHSGYHRRQIENTAQFTQTLPIFNLKGFLERLGERLAVI